MTSQERRLGPHLQISYAPIGQVAAVYAARDGYVVCADLLDDARPVAAQMLFEDVGKFQTILRSYGYRVTEHDGLTFWCANADELMNSSITYLYTGQLANGQRGVVVHYQDPQTDRNVSLTDLAKVYGLEIGFSNCSYKLETPSGIVLRSIYVPECVADLYEPRERQNQAYQPQQVSAQSSSAGSNYVAAGRDWTRWKRWDDARRARELEGIDGDRVESFSARSRYPGIANDAAKGI